MLRVKKNSSFGLVVYFVALLGIPPAFSLGPIGEEASSADSYLSESNPLLKKLPGIRVDPRFETPRSLVSFPPVEVPLNQTDAVSRKVGEEPPGETQALKTPTDPIPIIQNSAVTQQILLFQTKYREQITRGLTRSPKYLALIQEILMNSGLPLGLAYLPLIESSFGVHAVSRAKAVGLWQLMEGTAKKYGLRVDSWIDERRDPIKSTYAAAAYLKDLYAMFNSWGLSLASYNAGEHRIIRTMAKTKALDYWELKASGEIPRETQHFVPKFMAGIIVAKDPEQYGFSSLTYYPPFRYDEVTIKQQTSLNAIARATGIPLEEIEAFNPELRRGTTPPHYPNYRLKLPPETKEVFIANQSKIEQPHRHRVKKGETLGTIARHYRVPMKEIIRANRIHSPSRIQSGQSLIIPHLRHQVKNGETLSSIARHYRVPVEEIIRANRIHKDHTLQAGRFLIIPQI